MANNPASALGNRSSIAVISAFVVLLMLCGSTRAAFLINCGGCHNVSQNGMGIVNFQTTTNLGAGLRKVFKVSPGQTAVIQLSVTNGYGGDYALSINNLGGSGVNNSSDVMACTPDPAWTSYFPGTTTNFYMLGCMTTSPQTCIFNLVVKTNTPADFYTVNSQMAGYSSSNTMWSQQVSFYVQVVAATPLTLLAPQRSGSSFSVQVATMSNYTYYLEYMTNLTANTWNTAAQTAGDGTNMNLTDSTANDPQRFYRVRVQ